MDGDAWGSLWGFALILQKMGKDVKAINDCQVPPSLDFLWHENLIEPNLDIKAFAPELIISLDSSDTSRLWKSYENWKNIFKEKPLIVIDHHISNPLFGDINIVDPKASSTCELMVHIIKILKLEAYMSPEAATFFYTGLQTDSNMYFNVNTRPETLEAWAELMRLWADFRLPIMQLYKKKTRNQILFWQKAFQEIEYFESGEICQCKISRDFMKELWLPQEEIWGYMKAFISDLLINIEWVKVAVLIYPIREGGNKVSTRSQDGYNVAAICESFWWGGHINAAGFESQGSQEEILQILLRKIKEIL